MKTIVEDSTAAVILITHVRWEQWGVGEMCAVNGIPSRTSDLYQMFLLLYT